MANPFGELVGNDKLDEMAAYVGKPKTQEDRAREAMRLINDKGKHTDAATYVQAVKEHYGSGTSALCLVYNGTGDTLHYVTDYDWFGCIGRTPYPTEIGNGQWVAFHHVRWTSNPSGSEAAVVYRGKNKDGLDRDFLIAWDAPWGPWYSNKAYSDVGEVNSFQSRWEAIYRRVGTSKSRHTTTAEGCAIKVDIGGGTSPIVRAELSTPFNP